MTEEQRLDAFKIGFGTAMKVIAMRNGDPDISWTLEEVGDAVGRDYEILLHRNPKGEVVWKLHLKPRPAPEPELDLWKVSRP